MNSSAEGLIYVNRHRLIQTRSQARHLSLKAIRHMGQNAGGHISAFKGRGMEFEESRPYQPGDDIRSMDWLVTARTGKPHSKQFREEKERSVLFWVDFRHPMHFATQGYFKSVMACKAASALAWSASKQGDRIGGLTFSEQGHHEMRPARGDKAVMRLIAQLSEASQHKATESNHILRTQSLNHSLTRLNQVTRSGSLVFLFSDFRELNEQSNNLLSHLSRHNEVILVQLFDTLEQSLPSSGRYAVKGDAKQFLLDARNTQQANQHKQHFEQHQQHLMQLCQRYRMHLLSCSTAQDIFDTLHKGLGAVRP